VSPLRLGIVFAGLAAAGALVGAATGIGVAAVLLLFLDGPSGLLVGVGPYTFAASVGGACGALLAPLASLAFMRHVPLGRLFAQTAIGALVGGVVGLRFTGTLYTAVGVAVVGFLIAGVRLALVHRQRSVSSELGERLPNEELKPTAAPRSLVE
jgi:hypothetical protein